jgi:hypothetical protein
MLTRQQIDLWVDELAALAQANLLPKTFYSALLDRAQAALAASGGAVWEVVNRQASVLAQNQLPPAFLASDRAVERWRSALETGATTLRLHAHETPLLVGSIPGPEGHVTIIELLLPDLPGDAMEGSERLLGVFREIAADFNRERELAALRQRGADRQQFDEFVLRIHDSLDLAAAAYAIANDGRKWIGCDRLSVFRCDQSRAKSLAISGVDQLDRRGAQVASLERLASAVARNGEPVEWPRPSVDLPPQIDQALQEHLDIAHCRRLIVAPLRPRAAKDSGSEPAIRGVLIAESFDERRAEQGFRERTGDVARHGGAALLAALEHHDLPLLPLQVKLGRLLRRLQQRRIAVALFLAAALAVIGLLAVIPADLTIEARGTLQPQDRKHLFAPADGIVEKVQADHGARVGQGDPLLVLRDPRLDLDDSRVSGELQTAQARLIAVQTQRSSRSTSPDTREQGRELAAEEEQLKEQVRGLEAQHALLRKLRGELSIASPIDGVVLTWNTTELLQDRPVKQGQRLVTVADPSGPWVVELRIPDADLGHVLRAQAQSGRELPVSFLLATDPAITYRGQIERVAGATDVTEDSPAALTIVRFDGQPPAGALAGTSVTARIHCGSKPIGYVWLHDLIDAIRTQVLF